MSIVPTRSPDGLAETRATNSVGPVPLAGAGMVIHDAADSAVQGQKSSVEMANRMLPPVGATVAEAGVTDRLHVAACCEILTRSVPTDKSAARGFNDRFADAVYATVPGPWP